MKLPQIILLLFVALAANRAVADTFTVTNTADSGPGSLRQAVLDANLNAGADTINFGPGVSGTISLDSGQLEITDDLTLTGPGATNLTIVSAQRVLRIYGNVTISELRFTGSVNGSNGADGTGQDGGMPDVDTSGFGGGGAILSSGNLTVSDCIFEGCVVRGGSGGSGVAVPAGKGGQGGKAAGGAIFIANGSGLALHRCTFTGNLAIGGDGGAGGLNTSTFSNGGVGGKGGDARGGALYLGYQGGNLDMYNCTFAGNIARGGNGGRGGDGNAGGAGGIGGNGADAEGGAVYTYVVCGLPDCRGFVNCTLDQNSVTPGTGGMGGTNSGGFPSASGADGVGRGGGWAGLTVPIGNTIIAENNFIGGAPGGVPDVSVTLTSPDGGTPGHNLIGKTDGSSGWTASDLLGTILTPLKPGLGPLQFNGGYTPTMALTPCGPAVDAGVNTVVGLPLTDQRGFPRQSGAAPDIGAYEVQGGAPVCYTLTVNSPCAGQVLVTPDQTRFAANSVVNLRALPSVGWKFANWSGDGTGSVNLLSVTMTSDKSITANFTALSGACVCPLTAMVSWWPGGSNANDIVGFSSGTLANDTTFAQGKVGTAFNFDGVNDALIIPSSASLNFGASDSFTFEAWVRFDGLSGTGDDALLHKWVNGVGGYTWELFGPAASPHLEFRLSGPVFGISGLAVPTLDGNYHHLAVTVNRVNSTLNSYYDGVLHSSTSISGIGSLANNSRLWVGHQTLDSSSSAQPFHGRIDDLTLYNRALSLAEIQAIYNAGSGGKCLSPVFLTNISRSDNTVTVSWLSQRGLTYQVQYRTNLNLGTWLAVPGDVIATGSSASKIDVLPDSAPRFYRVVMFR